MIRSALAARIAEQNPHLYAREVEKAVDAILDRIAQALAEGDRVELRDFGVFSRRQLVARTGRNPKTGEKVAVAEKAGIHFKPSKLMQARINPKMPEPAEQPLQRAS